MGYYSNIWGEILLMLGLNCPNICGKMLIKFGVNCPNVFGKLSNYLGVAKEIVDLEISFYFQPNYAVPGGRISPSVSEADLHHHSENIRKDISHNVSIS